MRNVFEDVWIPLLNELFEFGEDVEKDDARIKEVIGNSTFIFNPFFDSPVRVNHKQFAESVKRGLFDIDGYPLKGEALYDYVTSLENDKILFLDDPMVSFVYSYPERLLNYDAYIHRINQFDVMISRLKENINSNRAVAVTYNPLIDKDRVDIPCLQVVQALVRSNELTLSVFFRSNDLYGAFPSNMMFLTYYGMKLADGLGVLFKGIDYHCSSLHIYETDLSFARNVIE